MNKNEIVDLVKVLVEKIELDSTFNLVIDSENDSQKQHIKISKSDTGVFTCENVLTPKGISLAEVKQYKYGKLQDTFEILI